MAENLFGIYIYICTCVCGCRVGIVWIIGTSTMQEEVNCGLFEFHSSNLGGSLVMFEIYEKYETINICVYIV